MLDDKLKCSKCNTLFYYDEVRNLEQHKKEEMPIKCPNCGNIVKTKLSHGYFTTYVDKQLLKHKTKKPLYYKNIVTGERISTKEFNELVKSNEFMLYNDAGSVIPDLMDDLLTEDESTNKPENYVPVFQEEV